METIVWLKDIRKEDIAIAGGKGANLAELYSTNLPVPPAFIVTAEAYREFLEETGMKREIFNLLKDLKLEDTEKIQEASGKIQEMIIDFDVPKGIKRDIVEAYNNLDINIDVYRGVTKNAMDMIKAGRDVPFVAVRSSATAEDLPEASFAGQQVTFLNVKGYENVVDAVRHCWASLFTSRAIYYRMKNNFQHEKVLIAVVVQKMVQSEVSGVMFTINPTNNTEDEVVIEAGFGLGEAIVGGEIAPDVYIVSKTSSKIKSKKINVQKFMYVKEMGGRNIKKDLSPARGGREKLDDAQILKIAEYGVKIENHYKKPMDIEWAVEGLKTYIVQARPITTIKKIDIKKEERSGAKGKPILEGLGSSPGFASGKVKIVSNLKELNKVEKGDVLVTVMTSPDYVPAMEKACAIVTDEGGITSHASIVSRELGIPCVVGTDKATSLLKDGQEITVDGSSGKVYTGQIEVEQKIELTTTEDLPEVEEGETLVTGTKIYMNLGEPHKIDDYKNLPFDGIGLMRIEFIVTDDIKKHPLYMISIGEQEQYIDKLAEGVSKVASTISPKPIVVRFSDFKTNEYKNLEGGESYEPHEENPMIGWRGVSRYVSDDFVEAFRLECRAIKKVRDSGLTNVHVMLPFVRNTNEVKKCLKILEEEGLVRDSNFKIWLMAEVPSMALITEEFAKLDVDGCSIGSNDLTQLCLGIDRDSGKLGKMGYFDERNPAVLRAISNIIIGFHKYGKTVSICGQAPSEYPEIVEFLIKNNADSVSINPDSVRKVRRHVASIERKILLDKLNSGN